MHYKEDEDLHPTTPYTPREQKRIMGDLYRSLHRAEDEHDVARAYYTKEAIKQAGV